MCRYFNTHACVVTLRHIHMSRDSILMCRDSTHIHMCRDSIYMCHDSNAHTHVSWLFGHLCRDSNTHTYVPWLCTHIHMCHDSYMSRDSILMCRDSITHTYVSWLYHAYICVVTLWSSVSWLFGNLFGRIEIFGRLPKSHDTQISNLPIWDFLRLPKSHDTGSESLKRAHQMCTHMYICIYVHKYIYMYIYIYITTQRICTTYI